MLVGNPDSFAIWCDAVDSWSTEHFKNGCFSYFIGGTLIWSLNATLDSDISLLSVMNCMKESVEDKILYELPVSVSYAELSKRAFPGTDSSATESDYKHLVAVGSLLDDGHKIFLIESGDDAKLIWSNEKLDSRISEFLLKRGEVQGVVRDIVDIFEAYQKNNG